MTQADKLWPYLTDEEKEYLRKSNVKEFQPEPGEGDILTPHHETEPMVLEIITLINKERKKTEALQLMMGFNVGPQDVIDENFEFRDLLQQIKPILEEQYLDFKSSPGDRNPKQEILRVLINQIEKLICTQ